MNGEKVELPDAWKVITKIYSQELCPSDCEWLTAETDPYNTGDNNLVVSECTVPVPLRRTVFEKYLRENQ